MKLARFINEDMTPENFKAITKVLKKDCKPFLNELNKCTELLYRGIESPFKPKFHRGDIRQSTAPAKVEDIWGLFKKQSRIGKGDDRKPLGSTALWFSICNFLSNQKFGWKFRSGVMTTSDMGHASTFGYTYAIFPIGDFEFVYGVGVKDFNYGYDPFDVIRRVGQIPGGKLYDIYSEIAYYLDEAKIKKDKKWANEKAKEITEWIRADFNKTFTNTNMSRAVKNKWEISIKCDEYYLIADTFAHDLKGFVWG
jgi:hypothetical protein